MNLADSDPQTAADDNAEERGDQNPFEPRTYVDILPTLKEGDSYEGRFAAGFLLLTAFLAVHSRPERPGFPRS